MIVKQNACCRTNKSLQEILNRVRIWLPKYQLDYELQVRQESKRYTYHAATNNVYRQMVTDLTKKQLCGL
jgi:tRNA/tmRNA/rRNA uracil-C5-methylase (TrmA/RlmC/RlmD family)